MTEAQLTERRPQHITIVSETFPPEINGVANTMRHLCQGLMQRGHHVTVVRPRQPHEQKGLFESTGSGLFPPNWWLMACLFPATQICASVPPAPPA